MESKWLLFISCIFLSLINNTSQQFNATTCSFTFESPTQKLIQRNFPKLKVIRIMIPNYKEHAIPFQDYIILSSKQLFLVRPSFNFHTAGLFAKSFYVTKPNITGKICGHEQRTETRNNDWFMSYIFKNSSIIGAYKDTLYVCTSKSNNVSLSRFFDSSLSDWSSLLFHTQRNEDYLYCCDNQLSCGLETEPMVYLVTQEVLEFLQIWLTFLFVYLIYITLTKYHQHSEYQSFVTNSWSNPVGLYKLIFPKYKGRSSNHLASLIFLLFMILSFSFLWALAPRNWPEFEGFDSFRPRFSRLERIIPIIIFFILNFVSIIFKIRFKKRIKKKPKIGIRIARGILIITCGFLLNITIYGLATLMEVFDNSYLTDITAILFFLISVYLFFVQFEDYLLFKIEDRMFNESHRDLSLTSNDYFGYFLNSFLSILIESFILLFLIFSSYIASNEICDLFWYNISALLIYPESLTFYLTFFTIVFILYDCHGSLLKPFNRVRDKLVANGSKSLDEIKQLNEEQISLEDGIQKIFYLPMKWSDYYKICDYINFSTHYRDVIQFTTLQITIIALYFLGIAMFIGDDQFQWESTLKYALSGLMPLIPKLVELVAGGSSQNDSVFEERYKKANEMIIRDIIKKEQKSKLIDLDNEEEPDDDDEFRIGALKNQIQHQMSFTINKIFPRRKSESFEDDQLLSIADDQLYSINLVIVHEKYE
eukprot:gene4644-8217_t